MHPGAVGVTGDAKGRIDRERAFVGYAEREEEGEGSRHGLGKQEVEVVEMSTGGTVVLRYSSGSKYE